MLTCRPACHPPHLADESGPCYEYVMPDLLTVHAENHPTRSPSIDDRGAGSIRTRTYAELEERSNRLAHVLIEHGVRPGDKVVWCGQNSVGVVEIVNASRKIGSTAVPLNYRLSDEEAAYVTDHSDARLVYVDADYARAVRADPGRPPEGRARPGVRRAPHRPAWSGRPAVDQASGRAAARAPTRRRRRGDDDLHVGHHGQAEGCVPTPRHQPRADAALLQFIGYRPDDVYLTTGPLYHSGPGGFMAIAPRDGPDDRAPAQVRPRGLVAPARDVPVHVDVRRADADPDDLQPAGRDDREVRPLHRCAS